VSFYENTLKTTGLIQAASRGEARCRFVSTHPRAVSFRQDAKIASTAGGIINPRENNTDGVVLKRASDGHRHPRFFLLSHLQHTMYFGTTIQFYKDKIMQSQYTSSRTHTLQIRRRRIAPACREHFRGGSEVLCFKSSRQPVAPPNDQSSFRTSSQISSINRRHAISIISNAISRSSPSVGIRPAPKSGS
jgi:hypothetical protein